MFGFRRKARDGDASHTADGAAARPIKSDLGFKACQGCATTDHRGCTKISDEVLTALQIDLPQDDPRRPAIVAYALEERMRMRRGLGSS